MIAGLLVLRLGIWQGSLRLRQELRGRDARRYYLDQGLDRLSEAYQQMLGATRLNYVICTHMVRLLRESPHGQPLAPRSADLPTLHQAISDTSVFAAITPSARIAAIDDFDKLATKAFGRILNINLLFFADIWLPIRGYYDRGSDTDLFADPKSAFETLRDFLEKSYREAERFIELPRLLSEMAEVMRKIPFNSYEDLHLVDNDENIASLRDNLRDLLKRLDEDEASSPTHENLEA